MQGTLNEIDIRSILQLIELGQRTGELFVEAYSHCASGASESAGARSRNMPGREAKLKEPGPFWFVFFHNGQIAYASDGTLSLSRLRDYLRRYRADTALNNLEVPAIDSINAQSTATCGQCSKIISSHQHKGAVSSAAWYTKPSSTFWASTKELSSSTSDQH
jgi:hypothetical protein